MHDLCRIHLPCCVLFVTKLNYPRCRTIGCCPSLQSAIPYLVYLNRLTKAYDLPLRRTNWSFLRHILHRQKPRVGNCMHLYQIHHRNLLHLLGNHCRNSLPLSILLVFRSEQNELQTIFVFFFTVPFRIALLNLTIPFPQFLFILVDHQDANVTLIETSQAIDVGVGILSTRGWCN